MCILYLSLEVVGHYELSVPSMSVMGFQKSLDMGGGVVGVSSIHFFLEFFSSLLSS